MDNNLPDNDQQQVDKQVAEKESPLDPKDSREPKEFQQEFAREIQIESENTESENIVAAEDIAVADTDQSHERAWYVIRVQSGKEDRVKSNLIKRVESMGMHDKISKVLVPTELVSEIRKGFKRVIERKLYPGYVMIEMLLNDETHYLIKSTPGVGDIAGTMSESEAERMLLTCVHAKDKPKPKVSFRKGQIIKIKEGAFENYDGIVDDVNEQKGVIKVRIEIFGRYTQVELGYWQVESV